MHTVKNQMENGAILATGGEGPRNMETPNLVIGYGDQASTGVVENESEICHSLGYQMNIKTPRDQ